VIRTTPKRQNKRKLRRLRLLAKMLKKFPLLVVKPKRLLKLKQRNLRRTKRNQMEPRKAMERASRP